jgi:hypothetical protein
MAKSPDEKLETLEKKLNLWRVLAVLLILLLLVTQRRTLVSWADHAESWMSRVGGSHST